MRTLQIRCGLRKRCWRSGAGWHNSRPAERRRSINANLGRIVIAAEAPAYGLKRAMASGNFGARIMPATAAGRVAIASNVLLDGRLALFHETEKWLAVADLHFGYELSQRAAGRLVPLWGMTSIEARLAELLDEYQPRQLIILGDLVHDAALRHGGERVARPAAPALRSDRPGWESRSPCRADVIDFVPRWETPDFLFQHGHCAPEATDRIRIIGHHHPAATHPGWGRVYD